MKSTLVQIDCDLISDWDTFHDMFSQAFGFPDFYGRNMNAWIDCMTLLGDPRDGLSSIHAPASGGVVLQLDNVTMFAEQHQEIYNAIIECPAFVNWRLMNSGETPVLLLSFNK